MPLRFHAVVFTSLLALSPSAFAGGAGGFKKPLKDAEKALDRAEEKARQAGGRCRASMSDPLENASDKVRDLRKGDVPRGRDIAQLRAEVSSYALAASFSGCPYPVLDELQRAVESLEEARLALWGLSWGGGRDGRDDGQSGSDSVWAQLAALRVDTNATFEGERAVKVTAPELRLTNMQGRTFYLGARYRSYEGQWSEWVTTRAWSVPSEPFVWRNALTHYLRYSTLAEDDFSDGRFVARVAVFDGNGAELAYRDVTFRVRLPQLPTAPPPVPYPPAAPPVVQRDCGTGTDVGCTMTRDGQYPMDAGTWHGFLAALRANPNESLRQRMAEDMFRRAYVTAFQLGMVLDLFPNESIRLTVARFAAPRVVNPQHALGFASKWRNAALATEYSQLLSAQLPGQPVPPPPVPPPWGQPPHGAVPAPPPPAATARDCGTGVDPGCLMSRNGQYPMDAQTYQGFLTSLKANPNELVRADIVESVLRTNAITALQLSAVLDLFDNELTRLDVAKTCAPKVVNPQHALGLAAKFQNTFNSQEYVELMTSQMGR
jgi:hypothetical protein